MNVHFVASSIVAKISSFFGRINGALLGWKASRVPIRSRVIGHDCINVGRGFMSVNPVWIEAVKEYQNIRYSPEITIGDNFRSSGNTHIGCIAKVAIGDDCLFGSNVLVSDHNHGYYKGNSSKLQNLAPVNRPLVSKGSIEIGDQVWIGDNAVVLGSVKIGNNAVIGANSVVTRDIPAFAIAAGNPAKIISTYG